MCNNDVALPTYAEAHRVLEAERPESRMKDHHPVFMTPIHTATSDGKKNVQAMVGVGPCSI
jgi:hypothetical protein